MNGLNRRAFLKGLSGGMVAAGGGWRAWCSLAPLSAEEAKVSPEIVRLRPEMEEVVRWIETTPRDRILDVAVQELKRGLSYRRLLGGLFLAGIRNIKPRPVGFKFHAVLVINSAHQLGLEIGRAHV